MSALLALLLLLDPAAPSQDWPIFRGDTLQTGYHAQAKFPDKPELLWKITVPEGVRSEAIGAKLEDGILTVTLPKQEQRKPKVIEVS